MGEEAGYERRDQAGPYEPLGYILFVLIVTLGALVLLEKAGVSIGLLTGSAAAVLAACTFLPAHFVLAPGIAAFAGTERRELPMFRAVALTMALAPGGLAAASLAYGSAGNPWVATACGSVILALLISQLLIGPAGQRTGALTVPHLLEIRLGSPIAGFAAIALSGVPLFAIFCAQVIAFDWAAEGFLDIESPRGAFFCLFLVAAQVFLPGARGVFLGSAAVFLSVAVLSVAMQFNVEPLPASFVGADATLRGIAAHALVFVPIESGPWSLGLGHAADLSLNGLAIGAGLAVLPLFPLWAGPANARFRNLLRPTLLSLALLAGLAAAFLGIIVADGRLSSGLIHGSQWRPGGEIAIIESIATMTLLMAIAGFAAVLIHGMAIMLCSGEAPEQRLYMPSRRLAAARLTILLTVALAAVAVTYVPELIAMAARYGLAIAAGALFPATVAAVVKREISARAAGAAMLAGGMVSAAYLAAPHVSAALPAFSYVPRGAPTSVAALLGICAGALVLAGFEALGTFGKSQRGREA